METVLVFLNKTLGVKSGENKLFTKQLPTLFTQNLFLALKGPDCFCGPQSARKHSTVCF